jgi:hypothetical protein
MLLSNLEEDQYLRQPCRYCIPMAMLSSQSVLHTSRKLADSKVCAQWPKDTICTSRSLTFVHNMHVTSSQANTLPLKVDVGDGDPHGRPCQLSLQAWHWVTTGLWTSKRWRHLNLYADFTCLSFFTNSNRVPTADLRPPEISQIFRSQSLLLISNRVSTKTT